MDSSFSLKTQDRPEVVGVIDIGSNSIKSLVARRDSAGFPQGIYEHAEETRLSGGISGNPPLISQQTIEAGISSIVSLLEGMERFQPERIQLVATSAVRDAANQELFAKAISQRTGQSLQILSGHDEALGIAAGLQSDPAFRHESELSVFDIGGGSLEHINFQSGKIAQAISTELGAVRMTQRFIQNPQNPITQEEMHAIRKHTLEVLREAGVQPRITAKAVGTGGGFTITRRILAMRGVGKASGDSPIISVENLRGIFENLYPMLWNERSNLSGLPRTRADIYPAAIATLLALAEYLEVDRFYHSYYNLRYGIARLMMLGKPITDREDT